MVEPVRQFAIEKTAQLDRAEPAFEEDGVAGFRLGQGEFARYGPILNERVHRLLDGFGDPRVAAAPQERIAYTEANPGEIAGGRSCNEPDRIPPGGIERHEAVGHVRNAARQQARRVEGCR